MGGDKKRKLLIMNKHIIWGTLLVFAIIWIIASLLTDDEIKKEACITRSQMFCAASFIALL
jgi:hypothetical protein